MKSITVSAEKLPRRPRSGTLQHRVLLFFDSSTLSGDRFFPVLPASSSGPLRCGHEVSSTDLKSRLLLDSLGEASSSGLDWFLWIHGSKAVGQVHLWQKRNSLS